MLVFMYTIRFVVLKSELYTFTYVLINTIIDVQKMGSAFKAISVEKTIVDFFLLAGGLD